VTQKSNRDPLKTIKKEVLEPFGLVPNSKEVKLMEKIEKTEALFAPILIHKQPKDKKLKENKKDSSSTSVSKESSHKHSSRFQCHKTFLIRHSRYRKLSYNVCSEYLRGKPEACPSGARSLTLLANIRPA
jgi:hypothetical protein